MFSSFKIISLACVLALVACSSTTENESPPTLRGNWVFVNGAGTSGVGVPPW